MRALSPEARAAWPWEARFVEVDGGRMHFVDEGPRDAPALLCLHGNPTWSFYWRAVIARFAGRFRVVVPDHVGSGLSDKPAHWSYRLGAHTANVGRLIDHLGIDRLTLVVHDWGGAIGMGLAVRRPDLCRRFVITNTAAFLSRAIPPSIASVRVPGFGALAVRGANAFACVAAWRAVVRPLSAVAREGLLAPYDSWDNRVAHLRFVQDIPLRPSHPSYPELARTDAGLASLRGRPMLLCWGDADFCFTPAFRAEWERRFPEALVHAWADVGHYVMEDAPDRVLEAMERFLASPEVA